MEERNNGSENIWSDNGWKISKMAKDSKPHIWEVLKISCQKNTKKTHLVSLDFWKQRRGKILKANRDKLPSKEHQLDQKVLSIEITDMEYMGWNDNWR